MACDVCGRNDKELTSLYEKYQTDQIKQLCPDCVKESNKALDNMRNMLLKQLNPMMKVFLRGRRRKIGKV